MTSMEKNTIAPREWEFLADVLTTAVEGGIGYWSQVDGYHWFSPTLSGGTGEPGPNGCANAYVELLYPYGHEEFKPQRLTVATIQIGLNKIDRDIDARLIAPNERRRLLAAWWTYEAGDIDAGDADVIVQIGLLGSIVFS